MSKRILLALALLAGCAGSPPTRATVAPASMPVRDVMQTIAGQEWMLDRAATLRANTDASGKVSPLVAAMKDDDLMFVATFRDGVFTTTHLADHYSLSDSYVVLKSDTTDATLHLLAPDGTARSRGFLHFQRDLLTFEIPSMTLVMKSRWAP